MRLNTKTYENGRSSLSLKNGSKDRIGIGRKETIDRH